MKALARLTNGQTAPDFEMKDMAGNIIRLSDYDGRKLLVCFFRYAGCPWCNLALHRLTLEAPRLKSLGLNIVAFIQSEPENIQRYIYERHTPLPDFPIIPDPGSEVYKAYGIRNSVRSAATSAVRIPSWFNATLGKGFRQGKIDGSTSLVPAHFLIGPDNFTIHQASYGSDYFQDWPMIEILDFAQFGAA